MFRGRNPAFVLLEIVGVLAVVVGVGVGLYLNNRAGHPAPKNDRPVGGAQIDVSRNERAQTQATLAVDPAHPDQFLGASMDRLTDTRLYTSTGGRVWTSTVGPGGVRAVCGRSAPAVAIDPAGRRYLAFLSATGCSPPDPQLTVASRPASGGAWSVKAVAPGSRDAVFDARPAIAAGRGAAYVVWSRYTQKFTKNALVSRPQLLVTRSSDGGRTWTKPAPVGPYTKPYYAGAAVAPDGTLYVALADGGLQQLLLVRSTDGGKTFSKPALVTRLVEPYIPGCAEGSVVLPAQPQHCMGPNPTVTVHGGHIYVTYAELEPNRTDAVWVASFDTSLRPVLRPTRIGPVDAKPADQFLPVSAVDPSDGALWACYYDTSGDNGRKAAWFTCTASRNGGRTWAAPVRAASVPSNETTVAGDSLGYGYAALVAVDGAAHPFWVDARNIVESGEEIYTSVIPLSRLKLQTR